MEDNKYTEIHFYKDKKATKQDLIDYIDENKTTAKSPIDGKDFPILPLEKHIYCTSDDKDYKVIFNFKELVESLKE